MRLSRGVAAFLLTLTPAWAEGVSAPGAPKPAGDAGVAIQYAPGSGSGGCAQATAYLARAPGETTHAADLTTLICGLVADGVWAKLDALYVLAQQNATDAQLNLIGTNYGLTIVGANVFTPYRGYNNFGSIGSLTSAFNAATAISPNFTQNSASFGAWVVAGIIDPDPIFGNSGGATTGASNLFNDYTGNLFYARVNDPTVASVPNPATAGLYVGDRPSSTTVIPYCNGVAQSTQTSTSGVPFSGNFMFGYLPSVAGATSQQLAAGFIGASLGAAGQLALYNRLRTYMTSIGVP